MQRWRHLGGPLVGAALHTLTNHEVLWALTPLDIGEIEMKVSTIMTRNVISVTADTTIFQASKLMMEAKISCLPVVDFEGNLIGIVTETDFIRRAELGTERRRSRWLELITSPGKMAEEFTRSHGRRIGEIMTAPVHAVTEDALLVDAVNLMERHNIKRLPVVRDGKPIGMLTPTNLLTGIVCQAHSGRPEGAADWAIREQVLRELKKQPWASVYAIDVTVREGVVHLSGTILDERERKALIVAAENVPGVVGVHDHVVFIEPRTGIVIYNPDAAAVPQAGAS